MIEHYRNQLLKKPVFPYMAYIRHDYTWPDINHLEGPIVLAYKGKVNYLLHQAAYNGCCELLEFLVRSNCPLAYHSRSAIGHTPFHLACISGSVPFLRRLFALSSRQDVVWSISRDIYGYTPMIYAVRFGHHLCVAELCAEYKRNEGHMFDIDKININGQTLLTIAASRGHALVCKVLLAYEADINLADRKSGHLLSCVPSITDTKMLFLCYCQKKSGERVFGSQIK
jgi:ankyrin repeat protein